MAATIPQNMFGFIISKIRRPSRRADEAGLDVLGHHLLSCLQLGGSWVVIRGVISRVPLYKGFYRA